MENKWKEPITDAAFITGPDWTEAVQSLSQDYILKDLEGRFRGSS